MTTATENPNALPEDVSDIVALAALLLYRASDLRKINPRAAAILMVAAADLELCAGRGQERSELPESMRQEIEAAIAPRH